MYHWEFEKDKKSLSVAVNGPLIVGDVEIAIRAAMDGVGFASVSDERVAAELTTGELVRVLEDGANPSPVPSSITRAGGSNPLLYLP